MVLRNKRNIYCALIAIILVLCAVVFYFWLAQDTYKLERELFLAIRNGEHSRIGLLIDQGADPEAVSRSDLKEAVGTKTRPIIVASEKGDLIATKILVHAGSDVNITNHLHDTALMGAVVSGNFELVRYLLSKGAKIDSLNRDGQSPLSLARERGLPEIEKMLTTYAAPKE